LTQLKIVLEMLLLSSVEPLTLAQMRSALDEDQPSEVLQRCLDALRSDWRDRGLELVCVAEGWRFQTRVAFQRYLQRMLTEKPPKYSRAVMETLAVIAYKQPVTRGDIEAIRGVSLNAQTMRTLEQRGWIRIAGHRNVPGRPALFVTTPQFLSDLNLRALDELPSLQADVDLSPDHPVNARLEL
jgi:segregation and condensation protein B